MSVGLNCSLCKQKYKLHDFVRDASPSNDTPMLLKCGHTYCNNCLLRIYESKQRVLCPACKKLTTCFQEKGNLVGLLPNMSVLGQLSLRDILVTSSELFSETVFLEKPTILKDGPSQQKCSECVKQIATTRCVQCRVSMCCECFDNVHAHSRVLRQHQGVPLSHGGHDVSSLDCDIHHSMTELYCVDDEKLVCRDCVNSDHSTHQLITLQEKAEQMRFEVKQAAKEATFVLSSLSAHVHEIELEIQKIQAEAKIKSNKILDYFVEISGKVQSNFLSALNDLKRLSHTNVDQLLGLRDTALRRMKLLEDQCADANLVINPSSKADSCVVNPIRILAQLQQANEYSLVLDTISNVKDCTIDANDGELFYLNVNEEIMENALFWLSVRCCHDVKYVARKHDGKIERLKDRAVEDMEGSVNGIDLLPNGKEKLRLVCVPPACNQEHVYVTRVLTPHNFYIQRNCDQERIKQIQRSLQVFSLQPARPDEIISCIRKGELCVACSPSRQWCRVKIIKILKRPERYTNRYNNLDELNACSKDDVEVLYIDYGRVSKTKVSCLRTLPHKLQRIPPLAFSCSLVGVIPYSDGSSWKEEAISIFSKMVANRPVLMTTMSKDSGRRYVDLHKPAPDEIDNDVPVSVRDAMIFLKLARFGGNELLRFDEPLKHREYFKPTTLPSRSFVSVVLSHFQCISRFFVQQLDSNASYLENLTHKIQKFVNIKRKGGFDASSPFCVLCPYVGMPCLAMYECCNMWYRARIVDVFEDTQEINVVYVDYGNEARISVHDTLKIPDIYMKLPYQGILCQLADIEPPLGQTEWKSESLDRFFELVGEDRQLKMYIKLMENGTYNVELFDELDNECKPDNTLSVNERLVHEGLAAGLTAHRVVTNCDLNRHSFSPPIDAEQGKGKSTPIKQASPTQSTRMFTGNAKLMESSFQSSSCYVMVVQCESPASFHVQNKNQWALSNSLTRELHKQITEQDKKSCCKEWCSGHFCVFYSFQEKRWCRGKVKEIHKRKLNQTVTEQSCVVYAMDFGFTETTLLTSLLELPDNFVSTSPCVTKCFLVNIQPAGGTKWTRNAIEAFKEFVLNKRCKLVAAEGIAENWESLPVKLYLSDDDDVGRKLVLKGVALPILKFGCSSSQSLTADSSTPLSRIQLHFELSEAAYQRAENLCLASADASSQGRSDTTFDQKKLEEQLCSDAEPTSPDVAFSFTSINGISSLPSVKQSFDQSTFSDNTALAVFPQNINTFVSSNDIMSMNAGSTVTPVDILNPENHSDANYLRDVVNQHCPLTNLSSVENKDTDGRFEDAFLDESLPLTPRKNLITSDGEVNVHTFSNKSEAAAANTLQSDWHNEIPPAESLSIGERFDCIVSHIDQYNVVYLKRLPTKNIFPQGKGFVMTALSLDDFAVGYPCLACFDEDDDWHRAEVAGYESKLPYVRYVDYGLVQRIDNLKRLLVLPPEFVHTPAQAIPCCLASMPSPTQIGMDESDMMAMLANLIGRSTFMCFVVHEKSNLTGLPLVKLYSKDDDVLVADQFLKVLKDAHLPQLKIDFESN